jgi:hypothetical protein
MSANPGGKGDAPRPKSVDEKTFSDNWARIFPKPEPEKKD